MSGKAKNQIDRRDFIINATVAGSAGLAMSNYPSQAIALTRNETFNIAKSMKKSSLEQELIGYMQSIETIDAHEHLAVESQRVAFNADILTVVGHYIYTDTISAGKPTMPGEWIGPNNYFMDTSVPLEERWKNGWPYLEMVKYGSFYRPAKIALRDIYGIDDLNEKTYMEATEKIRAANKPGLYNHVLKEKSNIKACLVQNGLLDNQDPADLLIPVFTGTASAFQFVDQKSVVDPYEQRTKSKLTNLDDYLNLLYQDMEYAKKVGAVGCKLWTIPSVPTNVETARKDFEKFLTGEQPTATLKYTALDLIVKKATELDMPVPIHTGVWGDFRMVDPKYLIQLVSQNPEAKIDLYHLGMPYVRDAIFIGKNYPNVYLNLCWTYIVSEEITRQAINEIIDTVPINKVIAFGGDYGMNVENVYGHLVMAREVLAEALAERIQRGRIDTEGAKKILKLWLYDNPKRLYKLKFDSNG